MKKLNLLLCLLGFILCFCTISNANQKWCVAKSPAPKEKLQGFLDYACGKIDCSGINPGGVCYEPNTLANHASYALDLDYRATGVCNPEIGIPTIADPSYGACHYP